LYSYKRCVSLFFLLYYPHSIVVIYIISKFDRTAVPIIRTLIDRAILTLKNKDVDALNDHAVQSFPGEEKIYLSADRLAQDENEGAYPTEL